MVWRSSRRKPAQPQRGGRLQRAGWSERLEATSAASKGGKDSQPWTDDEEESVQDMAVGDGPAQSLGRAKIEQSVT